MDRHTVASSGDFTESPDDQYLENNCVDDPVKLCDFQLLENRIMKTVDSVYQVDTNPLHFPFFLRSQLPVERASGQSGQSKSRCTNSPFFLPAFLPSIYGLDGP